MNKFIVYADLHIGAGNYGYDGELIYGENVAYVGDCFEFKNIKKKHVAHQRVVLSKHLENVAKTKTINVAGNHGVSVERDANIPYDIIVGDVLFTHLHRALYSENKAAKWESRSPGINVATYFWQRWFKRTRFSESKWKEPSSATKKQIADYARKFGVNKIVGGHMHITWRGNYNGVEIQICGRGRSEIEI